MWKPPVSIHIDSTVASAGAALLCSALAQYLFTWEAEVYSETLCWIALLGIFKLSEKWDDWSLSQGPNLDHNAQSAPSWVLWTVALCIAVQSVGKSEYGVVVLFVSSGRSSTE
jgi:hypothetical protein